MPLFVQLWVFGSLLRDIDERGADHQRNALFLVELAALQALHRSATIPDDAV